MSSVPLLTTPPPPAIAMTRFDGHIPDESKGEDLPEVKGRLNHHVITPLPPTHNLTRRRNNRTREQDKHAKTWICRIGTLAMLGGTGCLLFAYGQEAVKADCAKLSRITNGTHVPCYDIDKENFIVDKCVDKCIETIELKPWVITMACMNVAASIFAHLFLKCTAEAYRLYLRHESRPEHTRIFKKYLIPLTNSLQVINALVLPYKVINHRNDRCITVCNENFSTMMDAQIVIDRCMKICHSSPIFDSKWFAILIVQTAFTAIFGYVNIHANSQSIVTR